MTPLGLDSILKQEVPVPIFKNLINVYHQRLTEIIHLLTTMLHHPVKKKGLRTIHPALPLHWRRSSTLRLHQDFLGNGTSGKTGECNDQIGYIIGIN